MDILIDEVVIRAGRQGAEVKVSLGSTDCDSEACMTVPPQAEFAEHLRAFTTQLTRLLQEMSLVRLEHQDTTAPVNLEGVELNYWIIR